MRNACSKGRQWRGATTAAVICVLAILAAAAPALAEHTRWWRQDSFADFDKGTAKGVALRSDGKLFLAPRFAEFADLNLAYLLEIRADTKGNLYAAGGSNAKVVRLDASGKATTIFQSSELSAQALALDAAGNVYVGTSPDGKVYKVTPAGKSSVFFDPKTKYIWDLAVDKDGTVYVATGDTGKIFSVSPDGKGQVFYSSDATHIRTLALDGKGNLLAGTEPSGQVLRIPKAGNPRRAFVLYETSKKEITALLQDAHGNLYVAAVGEKTAPSRRPLQPLTPPSASFVMGIGQAPNMNTPAQQTVISPFNPLLTRDSSSVYRIAPDGSPDELWTSSNEVVYTLGMLPNGKLLLGTGNQSAVIQLDGNHMFSRLVKAASRQITSIATGPGGKLFLASANPGKIFTLGPGNEPEGTFESQPFDALIFSRWGRMQWWGKDASPAGKAGEAQIEFYARSGNTSDPESNWSDWAGPYSNLSGDKLDCPPARFLQWKAVLRSGKSAQVPQIDWVSVAYLPKNVAPDVTAIAVQDPGIRLRENSIMEMGVAAKTPVHLRMPEEAGSVASSNSESVSGAETSPLTPHVTATPQGYSEKGYQSVLWTASDANNDNLEYSVYFRGENEKAWRLLKDKLDSPFYSWDTTTMPDGAYYLKIVASDALSNPAGEALTSERESGRFVVDNTTPGISQLTAKTDGASAVRIQFQASDSASFIARAQYSVDSSDWELVFPIAGLSDAPRESYDFQLHKLAPGEHTITVRVYDQFENVSTAKSTVRISTSGN